MATDIVGFSRFIETDEAKTLQAVRHHRGAVVDPLITSHNGRTVKLVGDGAIVEFSSVIDAVICAVAIQKALAESQQNIPVDERLEYRIGINLGDVVVDGDDLYGDGVNIAARLEALAEPGGICINDTVQRQLAGKTDFAFEDAGEHNLKNIERPVRIWRWKNAQVNSPSRPPLPNKPSIAVLPFTNMSADPDQEFFSDGITEDIITELSRYRSLFVVARNSSFVYRGRAVDSREVGKALGVKTVLEGSVRKAGNRVRVTAQLIEADTGEHLWADRYDGDLVDIFSLQDEISRTIVSTIAGRVEERDADRAAARPLTDLNAYEQVLRGQKFLHRYSREDYDLARECFMRALEIDPAFARAHGYLALVKAYNWFWDVGPDQLSRAIETGERGLLLDPHEAKCHLALGLAYLFSKSHDKAGHHFARCTELNPNDDLAMVEHGRYHLYIGKPGEGAELVRRAMRRNPFHPNWYWNILGRCLHMLGEYEAAIVAFENLTVKQVWTNAYLVACHACLEHTQQASEYAAKTLELEPGFRLAEFAKVFPYKYAEDLNRFIDGFRRGGLSE